MQERSIPERVLVVSPQNINSVERFVSLGAGVWLFARLIQDRKFSSKSTKLAFAVSCLALLSRSFSGHSRLYSALQFATRKRVPIAPETTSVGAVSAVQRTITIRASIDEIQLFFAEAPRLSHVSVELSDTPLSDRERPFRLQLESGQFIDGLFVLLDGPFEKGTEIQARIRRLPYGISPSEADNKLRQILRAAKQMIETGEVATVDGQTHGIRSQETIASRIRERMRHAGTLLERS